MKAGRGYYRKPCLLGTYWLSHGSTHDGQALLGPCTCGKFEACRHCSRKHVYVKRCRPCGSRSLPGRAA